MKFVRIIAFFLVISFVACKQSFKVKSFDGGNITVDSIVGSDSIMQADISPFKSEVDNEMNRVIGFSEMELLSFKPESPLSNLISDILQQRAKKFIIQQEADSLNLMSLMNIKGLRAPIPNGEISVRNIFELMPFENEIVLLTIPGDSIISLFNFLGITDGDGISGASVKYQDNKITHLLIDGKPVDNSKNYFLATSDYLANGGDYYSMILNPINRQYVGIRIREAIIEYIEEQHKSGKKITSSIDNRLIFN